MNYLFEESFYQLKKWAEISDIDTLRPLIVTKIAQYHDCILCNILIVNIKTRNGAN